MHTIWLVQLITKISAVHAACTCACPSWTQFAISHHSYFNFSWGIHKQIVTHESQSIALFIKAFSRVFAGDTGCLIYSCQAEVSHVKFLSFWSAELPFFLFHMKYRLVWFVNLYNVKTTNAIFSFPCLSFITVLIWGCSEAYKKKKSVFLQLAEFHKKVKRENYVQLEFLVI